MDSIVWSTQGLVILIVYHGTQKWLENVAIYSTDSTSQLLNSHSCHFATKPHNLSLNSSLGGIYNFSSLSFEVYRRSFFRSLCESIRKGTQLNGIFFLILLPALSFTSIFFYLPLHSSPTHSIFSFYDYFLHAFTFCNFCMVNSTKRNAPYPVSTLTYFQDAIHTYPTL